MRSQEVPLGSKRMLFDIKYLKRQAREGCDDSIYFQCLPVNVAAMLISERNSLIAALILPLEKLCSNSHFLFERNEKMKEINVK